jgi:outer membrane translocation and assembly module TamA
MTCGRSGTGRGGPPGSGRGRNREPTRLSDVRKVGGFGLRIRTPYFLLRADYGMKLDRKPREPLGKFFFSIGQAF